MENTKNKRLVQIYTEMNPNPNSLKFVANFMLVEPGKSYDFPDKESASVAPLARELFDYDYVRRVFYMSNFITVTKSDAEEWSEITAELKAHIKEYLEADKPLLTGEPELITEEKTPSTEPLTEDSDMEVLIKGVLEEYVKPAVEQDGGYIQYHSYKDGVVKVLLQGSCSGCPSSMVTLKAGIENLLKSMIPEIKSVEAEGV